MRKLLPLLAVLLIVGCTKPETPAQTVYAAQSSYNIAATIATKYLALPRCTPTAPPLCSTPETVLLIKKTDTVAYNSIRAAQVVIRTPGIEESKTALVAATAKSAVGAFVSITEQLEVQ